MADNEKPHVYVPAGEAPPAELVTEDIEVGDGAEATSGSQVEVHYVGVSWRTRKQFDASWDRGDTFSFGLGAGQVITGWDEGVQGMKVGGRRRIVIPPGKAYGRQGRSEEHTSELQSLMRISYAVFCLKKKNNT